MSEVSNKKDIITYIAKPIDKHSQHVQNYKVISVTSSLALTLFYTYRYYKISKKLPKGYSEDLKSLTIAIILLNIWNFLLTTLSELIVLNIPNLYSYSKNDISIIESDFDSYFSILPIHSQLNIHLLLKDLRLCSISIISMLLLQFFSKGIIRSLEYISFISNDSKLGTTDLEIGFASGSPSKPRKAVAFDEKLTIFNHSESSSFVTGSKINKASHLAQSSYKKIFIKYPLLFFLLVIVSVFIIPEHSLLNSTSILFRFGDYSNLVIKFDHIYFIVLFIFIINVITKSIQVMNHPKIRCFPQVTSILTRFTWCYCCLILSLSIYLVVLFNDVLMSIIALVATNSPISTFDHSTYPVQLVTAIFFNYLAHSVQQPSCLNYTSSGVCSQQSLLDSLATNFLWLKNILEDCWTVLNLSCFVLLPMLIWIVIIELKFNKIQGN